MLSRTLLMVRAGLHCSFRMSRQMLPWEFTFGWYTLVWKLTCRRASQSNMGVSQPNTGPRTHTHTHTRVRTQKKLRAHSSLSLSLCVSISEAAGPERLTLGGLNG